VAVSLTAVIWANPLLKRSATWAMVASVWVAAAFPSVPALLTLLGLESNPIAAQFLMAITLHQQAATIATLAILFCEPLWFGALAIIGQAALLSLSLYLRESDYELTFLYLAWIGILLGVHFWRGAPRHAPGVPRGWSFVLQDIAIFLLAVGLTVTVMYRVFDTVIFNGDEVANSFQADVYAHFRAYSTPPACASMFENYWVFTHEGRVFSQYTPGWPMFMAPFQRFGVIWLAGPTMAGIVAVGIARLSRRLAAGVGGASKHVALTVKIAGPLGATLALLGPSLLLNGASRFSHTMVCACFAWAVESMCVVSAREGSRRDLGYGFLLGAATSLGVATRPADGGFLGIGVFLYFVWVLLHRRISLRAFAATAVGFLVFGGLTLLILKLQTGHWFQSGYSITALIHPEGKLVLTVPEPNQFKYGVPFATGSYCWWPAAPALGFAGIVLAMKGRERRVSFMLLVGVVALAAFYSAVQFGRGYDDGHGPRYLLPSVVLWASGSAGVLAPVLARFSSALQWRYYPLKKRFLAAGPPLLALYAAYHGVERIIPRMYPLAHEEQMASTGPLRAAKEQHLKNAIVALIPGNLPQHETNLAQNAPMDPNPDVLFLIVRTPADEACARQHFPGRTWYRAGKGTTLTPY